MALWIRCQRAPLSSDTVYTSVGVGDIVSFYNDMFQFIGGARWQRIQSANYSAVTGLPTNGNDTSVISPSIAGVIKPTKELMFYANWIQALQQGPIAGAGTTNAGTQFPAFVSTQYEVGAKVDFGKIGATLSAFQITMPASYTQGTTFVVDGQNQNRGIEFVLFGEPWEGLKLNGGFVWLDARQANTASGINNGRMSVGQAPFTASLTADYDTPFWKGFGMMGRVVYNDMVFVNATNTQMVPAWTRFDAGVRYSIDRPDGKPVTLRANVFNVFDMNYWNATGTFFVSNQPRTLMLNLSTEF